MSKTLAIALVLLTAIPLFYSLSLSDTTCDLCGQRITGTYYRTPDGHTYCADCKQKFKACAQCGQLTRSPISTGGRDYCPNCYVKLDKCGLCGGALSGAYTYYPDVNLKVCSECERSKPRCQGCGVPVSKLTMVGNSGLCSRCAAKIAKCRSCGQAILGEFSYFEGNEALKYCMACVAQYPRCGDCGAPSGPDGTRLQDGRYLCSECRRVAYFDAGLVTPIKRKVQSFLANHLGMDIAHNVDFSLKDEPFLKEKSKDSHGDLNGLFLRAGDDFDIYVLYGLREKDLLAVLPHEIAHAWQAENCRENLSLEDQEGFAQWVAYKTLVCYGYEGFARLMPQSNTPYASGLTKMLRLEKNGGPKAVFDYIKSR